MPPVRAVGHHYPEAGRMMYDGRVKFPVDEPPETVDIDGRTYQMVHWEPPGRVTPEDRMHRETR